MSARTPTRTPASPLGPAAAYERPPSARPRPGAGTVLDHGALPGRRDRLPEGSVRAALAGVEAAVFGWLCVTVPAVASYVATAAAPALGDATWLHAAAVGSGLWRLAHGAAAGLAGATVSVVPLGLTMLALALAFASARRADLRTYHGALSAALGYAVVTTVLGSLSPTALGGPGRLALGAFGTALAGALVAVRRAEGRWPVATAPLGVRLAQVIRGTPAQVRAVGRAGVRGAALGLGTLSAAGLLLVAVMTAVNHAAFAGALSALAPDPVGAVTLGLAFLALLPTVVVWVVSWLAGPGFLVGQDTLVAAGAASAGPAPVFPLLAGLPGQSPLGGWTRLVVVLVGVGVGWYLHRRAWQPSRRAAAAVAASAAALCGLAVGALAGAAAGAAGPGRMAHVGPDAVAVGIAVAGLLALGAVPAVLALRRDTAAAARRAAATVAGWSSRSGLSRRS